MYDLDRLFRVRRATPPLSPLVTEPVTTPSPVPGQAPMLAASDPVADAAMMEALTMIEGLREQYHADPARFAVLAMYANTVRTCHCQQDPELLNAPASVRLLAERWGTRGRETLGEASEGTSGRAGR